MQNPQSMARLASAFHQFGWVIGGYSTIKKNGSIMRRGRRIPVQATASGLRKYGPKGNQRLIVDVP